MSVFLLTSFALFLIGELASWILLLVIPSRKGRIRIERTASWPQTTPEQAREVITRRLQEERFWLTPPPTDTLHLSAMRYSSQYDADPDAPAFFTHACKPIAADVQIHPTSFGVEVKVALKMTDFVLLDTGESAHMEQVLRRLIEGTDRPPVTVPNPAPPGYSSLTHAVTSLLAAFLPFFYPSLQGRRLGHFAMAVVFSAILAMAVGTWALREIRRRPKEISGMWMVLLAFLIAIAALFSIAGVYLHLRDRLPFLS